MSSRCQPSSDPPPSRLAGHFPISRASLAPLTDVFFTPPRSRSQSLSPLSLSPQGPGCDLFILSACSVAETQTGRASGPTGTPPRASAGMVEGGVGTERRTRSKSACSRRRRLRRSCCTLYQSCSGDSNSEGGGGRLLVGRFSGGGLSFSSSH